MRTVLHAENPATPEPGEGKESLRFEERNIRGIFAALGHAEPRAEYSLLIRRCLFFNKISGSECR